MTVETRWAMLRRGIGQTLVLVALAALAFWGHHTGWQWRTTAAPAMSDAPLVEFVPAGVRFASPDALDRLALDIALVEKAELTEIVTAPAELHFAPHQIGQASARAEGVCWRVLKGVGDSVAADEAIAYVETPALATANAELLESLVQVRLGAKLAADLTRAGDAATPSMRNSVETIEKVGRARLKAVRQSLAAFGVGIDEDEWAALSAEDAERRVAKRVLPDAPPNVLAVTAPLAGVVTTCDVVAGEAVDPSRPLVTVVDARTLTATLHVALADAPRVKPGQRFTFRPDGQTGEAVGTIVAAAVAADPDNRKLQVRGEVDNAAGRWRAHTLAKSRIQVRDPRPGLTLPDAAVHEFNGRPFVFVRNAGQPTLYRARAVQIGIVENGRTEVVGLQPGDVVLARNSRRLVGGVTRLEETP